MKTEVILRSGYDTYPHVQVGEGEIGYIDGFVTAADGRPYAVCVFGSYIDMVPINCLAATGNFINKP